ncbi:MAG: hypothetical protein IJB94_06290 [Clostridia bacterium]|nr:hypothetical protein [Clostridia bacterium]
MKKALIIILILVALILLFPIREQAKDGGSVRYNAILYDVYDVHRIKPAEEPLADGTFETEYLEGIIIEMFGVEIFNNVK